MESIPQDQDNQDENMEDVPSILQNSTERVSKKKEKPHVTWDED